MILTPEHKTKDPSDVLDYTWDFAHVPPQPLLPVLADGETIDGSPVVTCPAGLTLGVVTHDDTTVTAWLSGGEPDTLYLVPCKITTSGGRTYERSLTLWVQQL